MKPVKWISDLVRVIGQVPERRRLIRDRQLIDRISHDLSMQLSLPEFLNRFMDHIFDAFPVHTSAVYLYDDHQGCLTADSRLETRAFQ